MQKNESDGTFSPFWSTTNGPHFTNEETVRRLYALARVVQEIFTKTGISYWVSSGTTLGCVRHQGLIPWDDDLDVCIYQKDEAKLGEAKRLLNEKGFDLLLAASFGGYRVFHKTDSDRLPDDSQLHRYPFCDILLMEAEGPDKCRIASERGRSRWPHEVYYTRDIENMEQRLFGDVFLNCPANIEEYLCRAYGDKWRTEGATHNYDHVARKYIQPVTRFLLQKEHYQPAKPFR